ncbi:MAG TPA: DUF2157 domain-containing protein [Polyangiales bacterium]|nr:DUF2157 domain-containing protein [Polyangiales bacterium]
MSLDRKLSSWVEAGVIDEATRQRIAAHEHAQRKPYALYAMLVLGGGTVALGLVSVIASNWDSISGGVKLTADLFLALTLAAATAWSVMRGRALATEVLVCVFYGFTLASLALVGQVYQLGTPTYQGLLVWSASTLPLVLLGRSRYLAVLVVIGLWSTHGLAFEALFEMLESQRTAHAEDLIGALLFASPFMYIALARLPWLRRERPEYAGTLQALSWLALLLAGFGLQFAWYESVDDSDTMRVGIAVTAIIALGFGFALPRLYSDAPREGLFTLCAIVGFGWLSFASGFGIPHGSSDVVGALMQLAWLAAFARASLQFGLVRVFNSLTALIALRIVVVYFEVFGSLLDTGLGLITGGALTLLLAYLWRRKVRTLTAATGAGHAA